MWEDRKLSWVWVSKNPTEDRSLPPTKKYIDYAEIKYPTSSQKLAITVREYSPYRHEKDAIPVKVVEVCRDELAWHRENGAEIIYPPAMLG